MALGPHDRLPDHRAYRRATAAARATAGQRAAGGAGTVSPTALASRSPQIAPRTPASAGMPVSAVALAPPATTAGLEFAALPGAPMRTGDSAPARSADDRR